MELLNKEQKVSVLKYAKKLYQSKEYEGMCNCIDVALIKELGQGFHPISRCIIGFDNSTAIEKFGATSKGGYWWSRADIKSRIIYFDWLIALNSK